MAAFGTATQRLLCPSWVGFGMSASRLKAKARFPPVGTSAYGREAGSRLPPFSDVLGIDTKREVFTMTVKRCRS